MTTIVRAVGADICGSRACLCARRVHSSSAAFQPVHCASHATAHANAGGGSAAAGLMDRARAAGACGACGKGRHGACSEASSKRQQRSADLERGGKEGGRFAASSVPKKGGWWHAG